MKKCQSCGAANNFDSIYCYRCGEKLNDSAFNKEDLEFEEALERAKEKLLSREGNSPEEKTSGGNNDSNNSKNKNTKNMYGDGKKESETDDVPKDFSDSRKVIKIHTSTDERKRKYFTEDEMEENPDANKVTYRDDVIKKDGEMSYEPKIRRITITPPDSALQTDSNVKIYQGSGEAENDVRIYTSSGNRNRIKNPHGKTGSTPKRHSAAGEPPVASMYSDKEEEYPSFDDIAEETFTDTDITEENDRYENRRKAGFLAGVLLGLILLVVTGSFIYRYTLQDMRAITVADSLVEEEKYPEAIEYYDRILKKNPSDSVSERKNNALLLSAEKDLVSKPPSEVTPDEFKKLISMAVESERYAHDAGVQAEKTAHSVAERVKKEISAGRYDEAEALIAPYTALTENMQELNEQEVIINEYFRKKTAEETEKKNTKGGLFGNNSSSDKGTTLTTSAGTSQEDPMLSGILELLDAEKGRILSINRSQGRNTDYNMLTSQLEWDEGDEKSEVHVSLNDFIDNYLHYMAGAVTEGNDSDLSRFMEENSRVYTLQKNYIGRTGDQKKSLVFNGYKIDNIFSRENFYEVTVSEDFTITDSRGMIEHSSAVMTYLIEKKPSFYGWIIKTFSAQ